MLAWPLRGAHPAHTYRYEPRPRCRTPRQRNVPKAPPKAVGPRVGAKTTRRGKAFCARLASCFSRCRASASKNAHRQKQRMEQRLKAAGCKGVSLRLLVIDTAVDSKNVLPNSLLRSTHCVVYDSSKETLKVRQATHMSLVAPGTFTRTRVHDA